MEYIKNRKNGVYMRILSEQQIENLAKALHERYIQAQKKRETPSILPDEWDRLPETIKELNRAQVREFPMLIEKYGTSNTEALARGVHECWMQNCNDKSDPRMVTYDELPEMEKEKDRTIVRSILQMLKMTGTGV